jgi:hypothetical protein
VAEHADREIALLALDCGDLREGQKLDVDVPADLDQLGGDDSHGAVIGREGLVQLGHHPANGTGSLHQIHIISGIREIQGGLHAGDSATNDHSRADYFVCHGKNSGLKKEILEILEIEKFKKF